VTEARWRSVLFVPADRPELASKAAAALPDVIVLDLEDAVPPAGKQAARSALAGAVAAVSGAVPVFVRVNPVSSALFADDLAALPSDVAGIVVPKFESTDQLSTLAGATPLPVVAGIETVRGVADARAVLAPPVVACYFGAEDYVADLGGVRTDDNAEVATARALVGIAARLAGIPALDLVTIDFHDDERFTGEAREARALGYAGKLCIHPRQVALANTAFLPSDDEVAWASGVLAAFDDAQGATIAYEGQMVDEVVAARARAILRATPES
jgi:citrate lyase subunit beta/citryl-CoA lyase